MIRSRARAIALHDNHHRVLSSLFLLTALLASLLSLLQPRVARAQEEIPINSRRVGERVFVTWACEHFQGTNMAVLTTEQGLVVIDTGLSPTTVRRQRALVEQELGRDDFRYLINTHMHNDHAFANEVFPEATVVACGAGTAALQQEIDRIQELIERLTGSREQYAAWAAETSPDSLEGQMAREGVAAFAVGIADLEAGITPCFPSLTFTGHHTLDLGDMTLELYAFPGLHSDSDILILVPEERLLFTGDVFWGGQLPLLREPMIAEFPRLMATWDRVLSTCPDLELVIPGHSDVPMTVDQFTAMHAYLTRLWSDVSSARQADLSIIRFMTQNDFRTRYPEVADWQYLMGDWNFHQHNLSILWQAVGR